MKIGDWVAFDGTAGRVAGLMMPSGQWVVRTWDGKYKQPAEDRLRILERPPAVMYLDHKGMMMFGYLRLYSWTLRAWLVDTPGSDVALIENIQYATWEGKDDVVATAVEEQQFKVDDRVRVRCSAPGCGKENDPGARTCWMCGNSVTA